MNLSWKLTGKHVAFVLSGVLVSLLPLLAKEYWEEKNYTQWNEQEAMAMLTNSPWSRASSIPGNYGGTAPPRVIQPGSAASSSSDLSRTGGLGGSNSIPLYIRWYSSQQVRQAMCRLGILHGNLSESTANEFLKQPMPDYAICISCQMMEPFNRVTFDTAKPKTFLLSKKDKAKKIELKSYSPPKERQDNLVVFMFPRSLNDKPTVELADDEIIFVTETGPSKFRATFKLARMVVNGNLDL